MGSLVHALGEQLSEHCVWPIIYTERGSMNDTDVPDVFCLLTFFVWPPEGDMQQWIVKTQLSGAEIEYALWPDKKVLKHILEWIILWLGFLISLLVSQQDIWCKDQDHQRFPRRGGQFRSIPPSYVSLGLPSDWPTSVYTCPSGLHPDSDCGGQSFGRGWTIWGYVLGNRWDTNLSSCLSLEIPYLTSRWQ